MRRSGLNRHGCERPWMSLFNGFATAAVGIMCALAPAAATYAFGTDPTLTVTTLNSSVDGDGAYTFAGFAAAGLTVHRITIDNLVAGDEVTVVFADVTSPITINTDAGSFFNALDVGQLHSRPFASSFEANPPLQWDTWLAIGNVAFFVTPGFPNVALAEGGSNVVDHTDMAWFAVPGFIVTGTQALVGQFSFTEGSAFEFNISINVKRGGDTLEFRDLSFTSGEPTDPTGACCVATICAEMLQSECATAGGVFHGADTLCVNVNCTIEPDPSGACCVEGKCVEVTEEVCDILGTVVESVYHGDDTLCSDIDCAAELPGACCIEGECVEIILSLCTLAEGTFSGEGTLCADVDCTPPNENGACCIFGECAEMTESFCLLSTGTFSGVGTTCTGDVLDLCVNGPPTTGACCIAGECSITTEALCDKSFGEFQGLGTECKDVTCAEAGACCVTGVCVQASAAVCELRGGTFTDEGVACDGVECELPVALGSACTSGYWGRPGLPRWPAPYRRSTILSEVFAIPECITDHELHSRELLKGLTMFSGEGDLNRAARRLMRQAVPALLNAQLTSNSKCDSDFPIADPTLVIQLINQTLATCDAESVSLLTQTLDAYNTLGCPVTRAGNCIDEDDRLRLNRSGHD